MEKIKRRGRPRGSSKGRLSVSIEARTIEALRIVAGDSGEDVSPLLDRILAAHCRRVEASSVGRVGLQLRLLEGKSRDEYKKEVAAGKWGK